MSQPVKIVAILQAKPGQEASLERLLLNMTGPSRAEAGCLGYNLWRDPQDTSRFILDELYVDDEAITAHRATSHFQDYLSKIGAMAQRTAHVVRAVDVVA